VHAVVTPPPAPTAPGTLDIHVAGTKDAVILVDGKEWGRGTTVKVELPPGEYDVVVKAPGRTPLSQHVTLAAGQINTVSMLVPAPPVVRAVPPKRDPKKPPVKPPPPAHNDDDLLAPKKSK
jgi:hypothetical protein